MPVVKIGPFSICNSLSKMRFFFSKCGQLRKYVLSTTTNFLNSLDSDHIFTLETAAILDDLNI